MKELFESFTKLIKPAEYDDILVVCHENPDGDAVGSAWGLAYLLRSIGKRAYAFCSEHPSESFEHIFSETPLEFDYKHVITVDVASNSLISGFEKKELIDFAIDHHLINTVTAPEKIVLPDRAACCEIIYELSQFLDYTPDEYFADCIYTGISTDTGCFKYSNVTERTFRIAAELIARKPGGFSKINKRLFDTSSMKKLRLEAFSIENVELLFGGKVAFIAITEEIKRRFEAGHDDLDNVINVIRTIKGVTTAIVAKEKGEDIYKISVRSEELNASELCARFGGGGHRAAAGCSLGGSLSEVKAAITAALGELI